MGGKLDVNAITCPIDNLYDKSGKFAALGAPKTDRPASSFGSCEGSYTIIRSLGDRMSNDSDL